MSISRTDICNKALVLVGGKSITSLTENSDNARYCAELIDSVIDETLCMHNWFCAEHRRIVATNADYEPDDYDYAKNYKYLLPANPYCLLVRRFNNGKTPYEIQGRWLYSDASSCELVYTKRITDTNEFTPLLVEAIYTQLAVKLTFPLKQSKTLRAELIEYLEMVILPRAKGREASQAYVDQSKRRRWLTAGR
jgi:hypothetical protein